MDIKVGDKFWAYDTNRREYVDTKMVPGCHFYGVSIILETSRSWIIGEDEREHFKVPKREPFPKNNPRIYTDKMKSDRMWMEEHQYKIKDSLGWGGNVTADQMREIAKIIGYQE